MSLYTMLDHTKYSKITIKVSQNIIVQGVLKLKVDIHPSLRNEFFLQGFHSKLGHIFFAFEINYFLFSNK